MKVKLVLEAIVVGIISLSVSLVLNSSVFLIGFFKHFLSGIFGLHHWYCKKSCDVNYPKLLIESLLEGIMFVVMFEIILKPFKVSLPFFWIGFILHILTELVGIHKVFCEKLCD